MFRGAQIRVFTDDISESMEKIVPHKNLVYTYTCVRGGYAQCCPRVTFGVYSSLPLFWKGKHR